MKYKITVITVVYNDFKNIEKTILSVINQTIFKQIEYIVIDGGSNDGTIEVINKFVSEISNLICEKDNGVYDAMNKGIALSKGEWINFMNSGDSFYNNKVLEDILNTNLDDFQIVYGSTNCFTSKINRIQYPYELIYIKNKMPFCHQSSFVRGEVLMNYKFDTNFKIASDYNLFFNLYKNGYNFKVLDYCISNYNIEEGISATKFYDLESEIMQVNGKWKSSWNRYFLFLINLKFKMGKLIKNIF